MSRFCIYLSVCKVLSSTYHRAKWLDWRRMNASSKNLCCCRSFSCSDQMACQAGVCFFIYLFSCMIERRRKRGLIALLTRGLSKLWSEFLLLLAVVEDLLMLILGRRWWERGGHPSSTGKRLCSAYWSRVADHDSPGSRPRSAINQNVCKMCPPKMNPLTL